LTNSPYKPAVSYRRVSTDRQGSEGIGLDMQKAAIDAFALVAGYLVLEDYSEAVSGGAPLSRRPELQKALRHAEQQGATLLVDTFSRLSRDTETLERIVRDFEVGIVSAHDGNVSRAIALGKIAKAQVEREEIGRRTSEALQRRKAAGIQLGNRTNLDEAQKLGSKKNTEAKRAKAREILGVLINSRLPKDTTARQVAEALNLAGVHTRQGHQWNKDSVREPLKLAWRLKDEELAETLSRNPNFGRFA
jgi:DNA invertase Pin-like site-specific DNA recombinase